MNGSNFRSGHFYPPQFIIRIIGSIIRIFNNLLNFQQPWIAKIMSEFPTSELEFLELLSEGKTEMLVFKSKLKNYNKTFNIWFCANVATLFQADRSASVSFFPAAYSSH